MVKVFQRAYCSAENGVLTFGWWAKYEISTAARSIC